MVGGIMSGIKGLWNSRKAWMAGIGSVILAVCMYFNLTIDQALAVAAPVLGYVLGQSGVDIAAMIKKVKENK